MTGATVSVPIVMVREFPFIEGSVSGVAGKLMLDTGYQGALTVNDHRVPISGGRTIGTGVFGSGQTFQVRLIPELADVRVGEMVFPRVTGCDHPGRTAPRGDYAGFHRLVRL